LVPKFDPIRLGAVSLVALTAPIPLLGLPLPAGVVIAVLFAGAIFGPLVNAPLIGVLTMRTPEALRPKVMTGVITMAMLAGPIGLLGRRAAARLVRSGARAAVRRLRSVPGVAAVCIRRAPAPRADRTGHARNRI
jgi:hypothetical protein